MTKQTELTTAEIVQALRCHTGSRCDRKCPYFMRTELCIDAMCEDAADHIEQQEAEIAALRTANVDQADKLRRAQERISELEGKE